MNPSCEIEIKVNTSQVKVENILSQIKSYTDALSRKSDFSSVMDNEIIEEYQYTAKINNFKDEISKENLGVKLATLVDAITTTQTNVTNYKDIVVQNDTAILELESDITAANTTLARINTSIGDLDGLIKDTMTFIQERKRIFGPNTPATGSSPTDISSNTPVMGEPSVYQQVTIFYSDGMNAPYTTTVQKLETADGVTRMYLNHLGSTPTYFTKFNLDNFGNLSVSWDDRQYDNVPATNPPTDISTNPQDCLYDTYPLIDNSGNYMFLNDTTIKFPITSDTKIRQIVIALWAEPPSTPRIKNFKVNDVEHSVVNSMVRSYHNTNHDGITITLPQEPERTKTFTDQYGYELTRAIGLTPSHELVIDLVDVIATYSSDTPCVKLNMDFEFDPKYDEYGHPEDQHVLVLKTSNLTLQQFYPDIDVINSDIRKKLIETSVFPIIVYGTSQ